jgi:hypothetical protein
MFLHFLALGVAEQARLIQDGVRDADFADVMGYIHAEGMDLLFPPSEMHGDQFRQLAGQSVAGRVLSRFNGVGQGANGLEVRLLESSYSF